MIEKDEFTCPKCGGHQFTTEGTSAVEDGRGRCRTGDESIRYTSCSIQWPRSEDDRYIRPSARALFEALWEVWSSVPAGQIGRAEEWEAIGELLQHRES